MHRALTSFKKILCSKPQIQINSQPFLKCGGWEILAELFFWSCFTILAYMVQIAVWNARVLPGYCLQS